MECRVSPKRPPDDHPEPEQLHERQDSDDDAARGIQIALCQRQDSRCDKQVAGKERQLVEHQRRDSRDAAEPSPRGEGAGGGPPHQDDRNNEADWHQAMPRSPSRSTTSDGLPRSPKSQNRMIGTPDVHPDDNVLNEIIHLVRRHSRTQAQSSGTTPASSAQRTFCAAVAGSRTSPTRHIPDAPVCRDDARRREADLARPMVLGGLLRACP